MKQQTPFGTWSSPITPSMVAGKSPRLADTLVNNGRIFWCEGIAEEKGRTAIMMDDGEQRQCVLPRPLSAKSKVHEYGGAAYTVNENTLYFVLADDQQIYQAEFISNKSDNSNDTNDSNVFTPKKITQEDDTRFSNLVIDKKHNRIIAVSETHNKNDEFDVRNNLAVVPLDDDLPVTFLHKENKREDFYASPTISPDGTRIAWLTWNHPNMPWDSTRLWLADLTGEGISNPRVIAGDDLCESIFQPQWSPEGDLYFVTDRSEWWNIYKIDANDLTNDLPAAQNIFEKQAEFATPQWVFGMSTYTFYGDSKILACCSQDGRWQLWEIDTEDELKPRQIETPLSYIQNISGDASRAALIGASASHSDAIFSFDGSALSPITTQTAPVDEKEISRSQPITYPTTHGEVSHALFYPPHNSKYDCDDELPPLIVLCHGGPTASCENSLNLKIQYWTNRGFAVVDVNYRGSTGYGRSYRHRLHNQWGVLDVDDMCAVVDYLAQEKYIDKNRCIIKGSSAGGYTVLAALAFRDTFKAGTSLYGIGDLESLAQDTHKFEARYLDKLVGPYPEAIDTYKARSPINAVDQFNCPLLLFQGLEDKVVPPNQAEMMYKALKRKGIPVAHVTYATEAHGFRQAETVEHMLDSELQFYAAIFSFPAPETSRPLTIDNLQTP